MRVMFEISHTSVIGGFGEDIVRLKTLLPSPYGGQYANSNLTLEFKTPEGEGFTYLIRVFGPDISVEEFCGGGKS